MQLLLKFKKNNRYVEYCFVCITLHNVLCNYQRVVGIWFLHLQERPSQCHDLSTHVL